MNLQLDARECVLRRWREVEGRQPVEVVDEFPNFGTVCKSLRLSADVLVARKPRGIGGSQH